MSDKKENDNKVKSEELIEEILKVVRIDKMNVDTHINELTNIVLSDPEKYKELGSVLVKCFENAQKTNAQFIKVIDAVQRREDIIFKNDEDDEKEEPSFEEVIEKASAQFGGKKDGKTNKA